MKTSFYFLLWIFIYPLLELLNSSFIDHNSFFVSLIAVFAISWLVNKLMPNTIIYQNVQENAPILEDAYTGNVPALHKRISRDLTIDSITAAYLSITAIFFLILSLTTELTEWTVVIIFALLAPGAISRATKLYKAKRALQQNPTPEECQEAVTEAYNLNFPAYAEARSTASYEEMFPPKPAHFKLFQIFSLLIAAICTLCGLFFLITGILRFLTPILALKSLAIINILYGTLATYFGLKDLSTSISSLKSH